jgi:hypothetical protein
MNDNDTQQSLDYNDPEVLAALRRMKGEPDVQESPDQITMPNDDDAPTPPVDTTNENLNQSALGGMMTNPLDTTGMDKSALASMMDRGPLKEPEGKDSDNGPIMGNIDQRISPEQLGLSSGVGQNVGAIRSDGAIEKANRAMGGTIDVGEGPNEQALMAQAQGTANNNMLSDQIGQAGNIIGNAFSRAPVQASNQLYQQDMAKQGQFPDQIAKLMQAGEDSPNSPSSKMFREYAKQFGFDLKGDVTASMGRQIMPMIFKQFEAKQQQQARHNDIMMRLNEMQEQHRFHDAMMGNIAQSKSEAKTALDANKAESDTQKQITQFKSRGLGKTASEGEYYADRAQGLLSQYPNLNKMPKEQQTAFMSEVMKLAKGGVAGREEMKNVLNPSIVNNLSSMAGKFINQPTPAYAGAYLKQWAPYVSALKQNSQETIGKETNNIIESNRAKLTPDAYDRMQTLHKPYLDAYRNSDQTRDPKIQDYANAHFNGDYTKAQDYLKHSGQL